MKFLSYPELVALGNVLTGRELGGCVLEAKIEAYSCKPTETDRRLLQTLDEKYGKKQDEKSDTSGDKSDTQGRKSADSELLLPRIIEEREECKGSGAERPTTPLTPEISGSFMHDSLNIEYMPDPLTLVAAAKGRLRADSTAGVESSDGGASLAGGSGFSFTTQPNGQNNTLTASTGATSGKASTRLDVSNTRDRRVFASLLAVLNSVFPDYDFSSLEAYTIDSVPLNTVIANINTQLSEIAQLEAVEPMLPNELDAAAQAAAAEEAAATVAKFTQAAASALTAPSARTHTHTHATNTHTNANANAHTQAQAAAHTAAHAPASAVMKRSISASSSATDKEPPGGYLLHRLTKIPGGYGMSFTTALWRILDDIITLNEAECFTLGSEWESHPINIGALWSFTYFLYNKNRKKVLFFSCCSRSKFSSLTAVAPMDARASPLSPLPLSQSPTPDATHFQPDMSSGVSGRKRHREAASAVTTAR